MPEETQQQVVDYKKIDWANVPEQTDPTTEEVFKQVGDLKLVRNEFDNVPGARFWVPEFLSAGALTAIYDESAVLSFVNMAINNGLRIKARGKLPKYEDKDEQTKAYENIKANGYVALSEMDAVNYVPGERELSASGYIRLAKKFAATGDKEKARAYFLKAKQATERELLALMGGDDDAQ